MSTDANALSTSGGQGSSANENARNIYNQSNGILDRFARACHDYPDMAAIEQEGVVICYKELENRIERLSRSFQRHQRQYGYEQERAIITTLLTSRIELITTIIAAWKAGFAFVSLDPFAPVERQSFIMTEVEPAIIISQYEYAETAQGLASFCPSYTNVQLLPGESSAVDQELCVPLPLEQQKTDLEPDRMCCLYFTSGSTGKPKGIAGKLKSIAHFIDWEIDLLKARPGMRVSQLTSPVFDAFLRDVFVPLCSGGTVCVPPLERGQVAVADLGAWIEEACINLIHCVPSVFRMIEMDSCDRTAFPSLEYILMAGETLYPGDIRPWFDRLGGRVRLINLYGPTETTMVKLFHPIVPEDIDRGFIPIGKPMSGARALLLDEGGMPCPPGVAGELYIRTPYRSLGYYKNPELTKQAFLINPFTQKPEDIVYKTGDIVRQLEDGNYQFLGRKDQQVKIRGVRVELGEVESALREHKGVREAAVIACNEDGHPGLFLVAYIVATQNTAVHLDDIRGFIGRLVPEYMIPRYFISVDELPRTATGKIDRVTLSKLDRTFALKQTERTRPGTPVEDILTDIWSGVLGMDVRSTHDNFFDLGGHSLLATQIVARARKAFDVDLPLRALFEYPTISGIGHRIEALRRSEGTAPLSTTIFPLSSRSELPLSFAQQRFWFLDQLNPDKSEYIIPAAVRLVGPLNVGALHAALNEIVRRHEILRTTYFEHEGLLTQIIHEPSPLPLPLLDLSAMSIPERAEEIRRFAQEGTRRRSVKLSHGPLVDLTLIHQSDHDHVLLLTVHHIATDGWSRGVFLQELIALYEASLYGTASPLPALPVQYADFAVWQMGWLQGEVLENLLAYWKNQMSGRKPMVWRPQMAGAPSKTVTQPESSIIRGDEIPVIISAELVTRLKELSRREGATLFMTLVAGLKALLFRTTGHTDIAVGTNIASRIRPETEGLIGFFVNQVMLRTDLAGNPSFRELLARVRDVSLQAYDHQDLPIEKLVEALKPPRYRRGHPLCEVMVVLQNAPMPAMKMGEVRMELLDNYTGVQTLQHDLAFFLSESEGVLKGMLLYNIDLFDKSTASMFFSDFLSLLECAVTAPDTHLSALGPLSEGARDWLRPKKNEKGAGLLDKLKLIQPKAVDV